MIRRHLPKRRIFGVTLCLIALLLAALPASAATGDLDPGFGTDGVATTDLQVIDVLNALVVDPSGTIFAVGTSTPLSGDSRLVVASFKPDGSLDASFSGNGYLETRFGFSRATGADIVLDNNGRVVVVGTVGMVSNPDDSLVARFNKDGTLDGSFATGGIFTADASGIAGDDVLTSVAFDPVSQDVVVAGYSDTVSSSRDVLVGRLLQNGAPDNAFGVGGLRVQTVTTADDGAYDLALMPGTGEPVIGGVANGGINADLLLARFTLSGALDTAFSGDGIQTTSAGGADEAYNAIAVAPSGKIAAAGFTDRNGPYDSLVGLYSLNGNIDPGFNTGLVQYVILDPLAADVLNAVSFAPDGSIAAIGTTATTTPAGQGIAYAQVGQDGTVQSALATPYADALDGKAMAIQADGRVLVAGAALNIAGEDLMVARLQGGCTQNYSYIGPVGGDWSNPAYWSPFGVPTNIGDCAQIGAGTVDMHTTITVTKVMLGPSSTIGGDGILRVQSFMDLNGGTLSGDTQTRILPNATLVVDGASRVRGCTPPTSGCLANHAIINDGTTILSVGGTLIGDDGVSFQNNGLLEIFGDGGFWRGFDDNDPQPDFYNSGIIRKSGEGTPGVPSIIEADFHNTGHIEVVAGDLQIWTLKKVTGDIDPGLDLSTGTTQDIVFPDGVHHRDFATRVTNNHTGPVDMWVDEGTSAGDIPGGYDPFAWSTTVEVQDEQDGVPADVRMWVDSSLLTGRRLLVFNHGVIVPECPDAVTIDPDPCFVQGVNGEGDAVMQIKTMHLGEFTSGNRPEFTGGGGLMPDPLPHAKRAPTTIDATIAETDPVGVAVDAAAVTPASSTGDLGADMSYTVTGGATATDASVLGGTTGTPAPLFADSASGLYRYPAGSFTVGNGATATGKVKIAPQATQISPPDGHDIAVVWSADATVPGCAVCAFDVQHRFKADKKGAKWGNWKTWQNDTVDVAETFTVGSHGTYRFRSRLVNPQTAAASGWSPQTSSVKVVD